MAKTFRKPPARYQPEGLTFLFEDRDILVVDKVNGLLTVSSEKVRKKTAHFLLNEYVRKGNGKSQQRAYIVHRLDRETSGVLVFAKSVEAKSFLQEEWHGFQKKYYAVVHGALKEKQGVITSYLTENVAHVVYSTRDTKKGKLAKTGYKVVQESSRFSLLEIDLLTGRKNQIRVHLADIGCAVLGDSKYGKKEKGSKRLALHAESLTMAHPFSKEIMTFTAKRPTYFDAIMAHA